MLTDFHIVDEEDFLENFLTQGSSKANALVLYRQTAEVCAKNLFGDLLTMAICVVDDASYKELTYVYNRARSWKKVIEETKKKITEPYRAKTSEVNERAKELTSMLDSVIEEANEKTCSYLKMLEERRKKREQELKTKASLLDIEEESVAPVQCIIPSGNGATVVTKKVTKFRITDEEKIPRQYLMINEDAIQHALKLGILEIPGIEIYEETTTSLRKTT